ncbi:hypothetical protein ES705_15345 [subsurface metagenome]
MEPTCQKKKKREFFTYYDKREGCGKNKARAKTMRNKNDSKVEGK